MIFKETIGLALCVILAIATSTIAIISGMPEPENENPCPHNYAWTANGFDHWQECSDCGEEKAGSRSPHLLSYGHCDCEAYFPVIDDNEK